MIVIRRAIADDIPRIAHLTTVLSERFIATDCTADGASELLASMSEEATQDRFCGPFRYFVAYDDHEFVGVVATQEESHLFHLFVQESHQQCGIGRQLWHVARDACLANGNSGRFTVNSSKGSRKVYESFGFVAQEEVSVNGVPFIPMVLLTAPCQ